MLTPFCVNVTVFLLGISTAVSPSLPRQHTSNWVFPHRTAERERCVGGGEGRRKRSCCDISPMMLSWNGSLECCHKHDSYCHAWSLWLVQASNWTAPFFSLLSLWSVWASFSLIITTPFPVLSTWCTQTKRQKKQSKFTFGNIYYLW